MANTKQKNPQNKPQQIKTMILRNYGAELKRMEFKKYVKICVFPVCVFYCEMGWKTPNC